MRTRLAPSFAALMLAGSACATAHGTGGPDAPVQLVVPDVLAWEPGGPFELPLTLVNGTSMPFSIAEPKVEAHLTGKTVKKMVYVPGRIISFIVG